MQAGDPEEQPDSELGKPGCGFNCPGDKPEILESGTEILGGSEGMEKTERLLPPTSPPKSVLCPHALGGPRRGFLCKVRLGARKTSGPQSPHKVPGTQKPQQWLGSGERGSQKHHQPVWVRLQGYAVPQHWGIS